MTYISKSMLSFFQHTMSTMTLISIFFYSTKDVVLAYKLCLIKSIVLAYQNVSHIGPTLSTSRPHPSTVCCFFFLILPSYFPSLNPIPLPLVIALLPLLASNHSPSFPLALPLFSSAEIRRWPPSSSPTPANPSAGAPPLLHQRGRVQPQTRDATMLGERLVRWREGAFARVSVHGDRHGRHAPCALAILERPVDVGPLVLAFLGVFRGIEAIFLEYQCLCGILERLLLRDGGSTPSIPNKCTSHFLKSIFFKKIYQIYIIAY